jgi:CubicO group peptidase (beta-lactamase class C family)
MSSPQKCAPQPVASESPSERSQTAQGATEPIWPTKQWQISSPEEQGLGSKELAKLVDFGTTHKLDSLLVVRHGKIVAEAYYAPYTVGIPHAMYSATKAVISTLTAIAWKDGLLDSPSHRVLDFFDRSGIENVDDQKETITVQSLLDMTSGIEWTEPLSDPAPPLVAAMEFCPDWVKFILDRPMWISFHLRPVQSETSVDNTCHRPTSPRAARLGSNSMSSSESTPTFGLG